MKVAGPLRIAGARRLLRTRFENYFHPVWVVAVSCMSSIVLVCWRCGASLEGQSLPLARLAECQTCHADLHVCRQCVFYEPGVANGCREPVADEVQDKQRANFCGYFQPRPDAFTGRSEEPAREARRQLESLFGGTPEGGSVEERGSTEAARARQQLDALFRPKEN
jgi:hypothetical protein